MSDHQKFESSANSLPESVKELGSMGRRKLMRAGLSAAPVLLALKSRSVLATEADICIKPSSFASRVANPHTSQALNTAYTCFSHGYWKNHAHPAPYSDQSTSYFLGVPGNATAGSKSAGFVANPGGAYTGKTLIWVLNYGGGSNNAPLARNVVGSFLTAVANGDNPNVVILTIAQCKAIWEGQGAWSPMSGVNWTLADTLNYFTYVYGGSGSI